MDNPSLPILVSKKYSTVRHEPNISIHASFDRNEEILVFILYLKTKSGKELVEYVQYDFYAEYTFSLSRKLNLTSPQIK